MNAKVAVLKTSPWTVVDDYGKLMRLAQYRQFISSDDDTLIKINLSWTKYFPGLTADDISGPPFPWVSFSF
jgi:hypothetical protein